MLGQILAWLIIALGVINLLRITIYMLGADLHDRQRLAMGKIPKPLPYRPYITVIVPAHNEEQVIVRCLESIYANSYNHKRVVVIDDGSSDRTAALVRQFVRDRGIHNLKLVRQYKNRGKARSINHGLEYAWGELVMVLDSDSYLHPQALERVVEHFRDSQVVMTAANVKIIDEGTLLGLIQKFEYLIAYRMKRAQTAYNVEYIVGGIGSTFRKRVATQVGNYDTDTMTEDIDFTMKILSHGNVAQRVKYAVDCIAYTEAVPTFRQLIRQRFRWKYGRFQTFLKNRQLFWNRHHRYDKRLTMLQLPYALFGEFTFLFEPMMVLFLVTIVAAFGDFRTIMSAYIVTTLYIMLNVLGEDSETLGTRLKLLPLALIQYPLLFVLSAVEYSALMLSIAKSRQLFRGGGDSRWQHVDRTGQPAVIS